MRTPILAAFACAAIAFAQDTVTVRPREIDDVLVNPGIGFTTFQRFNGDALNEGTKWTEGYPIAYQPFHGSLDNPNHPPTSIAYFRLYWRFLEPEDGKYRWDLIDTALRTAHDRKQTLMLRIAPYGTDKNNDVPAWYRTASGETRERELADKKWRVDPENPAYARLFGRMIRAFGARYDGHPDVELIDISIVGAWGEGSGTELLSRPVREALIDAYADGFRKTPLVIQPTDEKTVAYAVSKVPVGWRVDCLGDMFGFSADWCHMLDLYPEQTIRVGLQDAWKTRPVAMEACWVMQHWKNKGWDVNYIIEQSLKWHISTFNGKSSAVPAEWWPQVNQWLKKMGYRFALRRFTYPAQAHPGDKLAFTSWWENKGVAPCYRAFPLAIRLRSATHTSTHLTGADIRTWLPGDSIYDDAVVIPRDATAGDYDISIALVDPDTRQPAVRLAIEGREQDGWYRLGTLKITADKGSPRE